MPNNITNQITFGLDRKASFHQLLELVRKDDSYLGSVDFNKLIPMPDHIYRGNLGTAEREKYGKNNWYDWSVEHWGTKWNAYDFVRADEHTDTLEFYTAWSCIPQILKAISEKFPNERVSYRWADEDIGYNVGEAVFKNGKIVEEHVPVGGSKEAFDLAADIMGVDLKEYGLVLSKDRSTYVFEEKKTPPKEPKKSAKSKTKSR